MGLFSSIKKAASKVTSTVKSAASSVSSAVSSAKSGVTSAVSKAVTGVTSAVSNVKSFVKEGYLGAAVTGAIQGFASGGFAGMAVGAAAGIAAKKLASGSEATESIDIASTEEAEGFNLGTVDGVNAYFKAAGDDLTVADNGAVYSNSTGTVVGQYNFTTYTIEPPTEETKKAGASSVPASVTASSGVTSAAGGWRPNYNAVTKAYWTAGTSAATAKKVADSSNAK